LFKFLRKNKNSVALTLFFILTVTLLLCRGLAHADISRSVDPYTPSLVVDEVSSAGQREIHIKARPVPGRVEPAPGKARVTVDSHTRYARQIQAAAKANNIDAALIRAVISVESGYNPSAISKAGAVGLMQLMPETARRYKVADAHDPDQNIRGGARYLRDLLRLFNDDLHLAIAAYNAGEQTIIKYGNRIPPYPETQAYVPRVMKFYTQYSASYAAAGEPDFKRDTMVAQKKGYQNRVSRSYAVKPA
jgi:hypothetical protein